METECISSINYNNHNITVLSFRYYIDVHIDFLFNNCLFLFPNWVWYLKNVWRNKCFESTDLNNKAYEKNRTKAQSLEMSLSSSTYGLIT